MAETRTFDLAGGDRVTIRAPSPAADLERLVAFLSSLPADERNCLRYDVAEMEPCRRRLEQIDGVDHVRLVAELDGRIVGDATIDREPYDCSRHVAGLRGMVAPGPHELELGTILFRELLAVAEDMGIERLFSSVMPEHARLIAVLEQCGFVHEATLRGFARDRRGNRHDLLVYAGALDAAWEHLAARLEDMDIRVPP